jgi:lipid A 3-O-deacylase
MTNQLIALNQRCSRKILVWHCLLAFSVCSEVAKAQAPAAKDNGLLTAVLENDIFGEKKEDRNYTNGLKIAWMSAPNTTPQWAGNLVRTVDRLASMQSKLEDVRIEYEFGQSMFTPNDLDRPLPDPRDRPYAGLLYGSFGIIGARNDGSFEQLQLLLGVVGPSSRAKEVQRRFHKLISSNDPKGWDTQIRDRVAAEIRFQRTEPTTPIEIVKRLTMDVAPHFGVTLGNLSTSVNTGFVVRVGRNLPRDFGPPRISPSMPGSGYFDAASPSGWYLFGGLDARYVYKNLVLDAKAATGAGVTRTPWIADGQYGLAYYRRNFRIAYTQVTRTREFKEQNTRVSSFGALSLTLSY